MKLRVIGLILVLATLLIPNGCDNYKSQLDELQRQHAQLQQENQRLEEELQAALDELDLYQNTGIDVYSGVQPGVIKNELMSEVVLRNNTAAHNPTWDELMLFLEQDATDSRIYGTLLCGGFAELVHNNAEEVGIASAFVAISFEQGIGHAINAFNTTDRGLVFIDCTGESEIDVHLPGHVYIGDTGSHDKIAYVEMGKPIGHINTGLDYSLDYSDYEQWKLDVQEIVDLFQAATTNEEMQQIKEISDSTLGTFWQEDDTAIVANIKIYW
jgi:hypothetical protein